MHDRTYTNIHSFLRAHTSTHACTNTHPNTRTHAQLNLTHKRPCINSMTSPRNAGCQTRNKHWTAHCPLVTLCPAVVNGSSTHLPGTYNTDSNTRRADQRTKPTDPYGTRNFSSDKWKTWLMQWTYQGTGKNKIYRFFQTRVLLKHLPTPWFLASLAQHV